MDQVAGLLPSPITRLARSQGTVRGLGRALLEGLLSEAEGLHLRTVFALTLVPGFFAKLGFREVARDTLPMKVWRDCLQCEKYFSCDEKTLVLDLASRSLSPAESRHEVAQVSASCRSN